MRGLIISLPSFCCANCQHPCGEKNERVNGNARPRGLRQGVQPTTDVPLTVERCRGAQERAAMGAPEHRQRGQPTSPPELKLAQFLSTARAHRPFIIFGFRETHLGRHGFPWSTGQPTVHQFLTPRHSKRGSSLDSPSLQRMMVFHRTGVPGPVWRTLQTAVQFALRHC